MVPQITSTTNVLLRNYLSNSNITSIYHPPPPAVPNTLDTCCMNVIHLYVLLRTCCACDVRSACDVCFTECMCNSSIGEVFCFINLRGDIKSYGKFAIFTRLKIGGGWVKRADFGKIRTKDRNFRPREFRKIGLKIGEGGVSRGLSLVL